MKIGIIGAGQIGATLVQRWRQAGHQVKIANARGPHTLAALAAATGATAVTVHDAMRDVDVVVVSIPLLNIAQLPADLFDHAAPSTIVIDTGNYYPRQRDGRIGAIEEGMLESRWTEAHLRRPVIKAFNNIYATHLKTLNRPSGTPGRIALPVAGDDKVAKAVVMQLIDEVGFDAVDAGSLDESWRQQPGTPVYTGDFDVAGTVRALAQAQPGRGSDWRATAASPGTFEQPA
ncbi:NADPH-dependent F420 reductase [Duganella callida]|uniref:NADP oxidoreductase n=1 Tax=Duganella callida TaxID=2561932 RepID=A0A4Y9SHZ2_9BURK|nr:NAD(P)-binding domain-containing protein [Duganella callida]TFW21363.1 NADP oxidoreductase [Duganella callida]